LSGGFQTDLQNREEYYRSVHLQTIKFEIARQVAWALTEGTGSGDAKLRLRSRHQLFPQIYRLVDVYVSRKVDWRHCHPCELGLEKYATLTAERLLSAIEPNDKEGEPPLLPILNRYKPIGSTSDVNFKTTRACHATVNSHLNQVVLDTETWDQSAAFYLEKMAADSTGVAFYARNDHLEFTIPYEYFGVSHAYVPDYLVRLDNSATMILEIKGFEDDQDRAKHQAAKRWISAVNHWGKLGRWAFHVCKDPQVLETELKWIIKNPV
jgi:type III restriction enzyme